MRADMAFRRTAAVVTVALCVAFASTKSLQSATRDQHEDDPADPGEDEELDPRVIGGRNAEEGEFPWMVSLHYKGRFICSAFLVTPNFAMTAAHCVVFGDKPEDPADYTGYTGTLDRDGPEQRLNFTEILAHEEYGYSTEYDIALMRLSEPARIDDKCQPVCLPANQTVYENMEAQVIGWGVTEKWGHEPAKILQTATENVPTYEKCEFIYSILGVPVTRRHVCAGGDKDKGVCFDLVNMDRMLMDPDEELDPRVIGGRDALDGEFPWMVALHYQGRFICSSFLVTPKILMTAAHCVVFGTEPEDPKHYSGYAGTIHRDGPETELRFSEIVAHKEYGSGTEYDIALMKLAKPVQPDAGRIQTVCLPTKGSVYEDTTAQVIGWGVHEKGGRRSAEILQTAVEKVPTHEMCTFTYGVLGIPVTERHVCAGGERDKGICFLLTPLDRIMTNNDIDDELNPRVIGGRDALEEEFPWMVSLHYQGKFVCSSFLVTPKVLMTAAHCVVFGREPEDPKHYNAYVGTIDRDGPGKEILFDEIIAHKEYGSGTEYDIALMRLSEPVQLADNVQTVCLPTKDTMYEDMTAQVMGWGVAEKGGRESSKTLQTATESVPANSMCSFTYAILGIPVTRRHVCAGGERDKGICFGDSGSPLVALNETKPVAIGVASFGSYLGCAVNRVPAVYTATSMNHDWILENMGEDANDLCFVNKTSPSRRWWG